MSNPFKVGDRVRYICKGTTYIPYGTEGTVQDTFETSCNILIGIEQYGAYNYNLELIDEPAQSMVDSPKHYQILPGIQVRDVANTIADRLGKAGYTGGFISDYVQMLQYLLRFDQKGSDLQDLEKAKKYLDWLIADLELRNEA